MAARRRHVVNRLEYRVDPLDTEVADLTPEETKHLLQRGDHAAYTLKLLDVPGGWVTALPHPHHQRGGLSPSMEKP